MKPTRDLLLIWLAWVVSVMAFQKLATARLTAQFPDRALDWTSHFTARGYQVGHIYLQEPFLNEQVAWDSEYYLSIAVGGYDDPRAPHLTPQGVITDPDGIPAEQQGIGTGKSIALSYAFFPLYPLLIRAFAYPLQVLGLNPIATATLAGVMVSALGALLGMTALYELTRASLGHEGALRAAFYLLMFPTGFFLLQVYTEGLFAGLAFSCLVMLRRQQWLVAALLAIAATMTRAVGVLLMIPMLITWFRTGEWRRILDNGIQWRTLGTGVLSLLPLFTFLVWKVSYLGQAFDYVETHNYQRGFLSLGLSSRAWTEALVSMLSGANPQHTAYYLMEFLGILIGLGTSIVALRTHPEIAWFSLAVVLISWASGPAQGMHRYILGAPAVFVVLARWGQHTVFDRAWTLLSILLMGLLAMLFALNMWVG